MKKFFLLLVFFASVASIHGQILKRITDRAKNKAENNVNTKVDNAVDSAMTIKKGDKGDKNATVADDNTGEPAKTESPSGSIKAYSKYDFVPGEKVIGFEDFSTGTIGDFPAGWNTTSSAEIVTIEGKTGRWLWLTEFFLNENLELPD